MLRGFRSPFTLVHRYGPAASRRNAGASASNRGESHLLTTISTGFPVLRKRFATSMSSGTTRRPVDDEHDQFRLVDADLDLPVDVGREIVLVDDPDPPGIDEFEVAVRRVQHVGHAVARHTGGRFDDRDTLVRQPIHQRTFADIGATDDDDFGNRHEGTFRAARAYRPRRRHPPTINVRDSQKTTAMRGPTLRGPEGAARVGPGIVPRVDVFAKVARKSP